MRMSGFIVGGLVGAAVTMYYSKNNRSMSSAINWDQAVDKAGQFVRTAKDMWDTTSIVQMASDMDVEKKTAETH